MSADLFEACLEGASALRRSRSVHRRREHLVNLFLEDRCALVVLLDGDRLEVSEEPQLRLLICRSDTSRFGLFQDDSVFVSFCRMLPRPAHSICQCQWQPVRPQWQSPSLSGPGVVSRNFDTLLPTSSRASSSCLDADERRWCRFAGGSKRCAMEESSSESPENMIVGRLSSGG